MRELVARIHSGPVRPAILLDREGEEGARKRLGVRGWGNGHRDVDGTVTLTAAETARYSTAVALGVRRAMV